ncbi:MAG: CHAT domain-containing protein [Candidatus Thorarchaeota archaeon]|nr:MAG: CHAT domain-containing protein [Candidatus Thorarchaeota archaeon]
MMNVKELISAMEAGIEYFHSWVEKKKKQLTVDLLEGTSKIYETAYEERNYPQALRISYGLSYAYRIKGEEEKNLEWHINYLYLMLLASNTNEQFERVLKSSYKAYNRSVELKSYKLGFRATTLAAYCIFDILEHGFQQSKRNDLLLKQATNLRFALKWSLTEWNPLWYIRFIELLQYNLNEMMSILWVGEYEKRANRMLNSIAQYAMKFIPINYTHPHEEYLTADIAHTLGLLSQKYGSVDDAIARFEFLADFAEEIDKKGSWLEAVYAHYNLKCSLDASQEELHQFRESLRDVSEEFRADFRSRVGRLWASQELNNKLVRILKDEIEQVNHPVRKFFEAIESMRSRLLLDSVGNKFVEFIDQDIEKEVTELERDVLRFYPSKEPDDDLFETRLASQLTIGFPGFEKDELKRSKHIWKIEALYKETSAGYVGSEETVDLTSLMNSLKPDEILVRYYVPDPYQNPVDIFIIAVSPNKFGSDWVKFELFPDTGFRARMSVGKGEPIDVSPIIQYFAHLRTSIKNTDKEDNEETLSILETLYNLLISPLSKLGVLTVDTKRLIVVPDGILNLIPFAALRKPNGNFLIQEVALVLSPSASVWYNNQALKREEVSNFLGFANPDLSYTDLTDLELAEEGLKDITENLKALNCKKRLGTNATEINLRRLVSGQHIIHFATHGEFPEQDVIDFHQLLLSASQDHDGRVHAEELRKMDFRSARLVVLSICNGGIYRIGPGNELYGLVPALLIAGAENVIGTLWQIEDRAGRRFMIEFYKYLIKYGPALANKLTCEKAIKHKYPIRNWAGFALIGTGRPFDVK